jgi:hypothetical protein
LVVKFVESVDLAAEDFAANPVAFQVVVGHEKASRGSVHTEESESSSASTSPRGIGIEKREGSSTPQERTGARGSPPFPPTGAPAF